jgi:hypothetical protein
MRAGCFLFLRWLDEVAAYPWHAVPHWRRAVRACFVAGSVAFLPFRETGRTGSGAGGHDGHPVDEKNFWMEGFFSPNSAAKVSEVHGGHRGRRFQCIQRDERPRYRLPDKPSPPTTGPMQLGGGRQPVHNKQRRPLRRPPRRLFFENSRSNPLRKTYKHTTLLRRGRIEACRVGQFG